MKSMITKVLAILSLSSTVAFADGYPVAHLRRPSVLPEGAVEGRVKFGMNPNAAQGKIFEVESDVGILDNLQLSLAYSGFGFSKKGVAPLKTASIGLKTSTFSVGNFYNSFAVNAPLNFGKGVNKVFNKVSLASSSTLFFSPNLALTALHDDFVNLGFSDGFSMKVNVPVELGYQVSNNFYMGLNTSLASIKPMEMRKSNYIWNKTKVGAIAAYAINNAFDIGVQANVSDVRNAKQTFDMGVGIAYRGGNLG